MSDSTPTPAWSGCGVMPTLDVTDLEDGIAYYSRIGFTELWRYPDPSPDHGDTGTGGDWTHAGVAFGNVKIMLALNAEGRIERQNLYVFVDGVMAYHAFCRTALGDASVPELEDTGYGMRDFSIRDPWGHGLTFGEGVERIADD